ncbi:pseudouridine synthase [Nesterenkonia sp.]|uniref:pseudouridine synthase n=1 Tax=Nesterenkonia sp. TaxID=704201 RepID=UPI002611E4D7|nr:pseudouridine synthase [Nesterenkonia sp.]
MGQRSPLPVRDGVNATRLRVPQTGPWETIHDYVLATFGHLDPAGITARFHAGEVVDAEGNPVSVTTGLGETDFIWYYRSLPREEPLPVREQILFEDDHLLAADKPHFLPTTPAGRYVRESLLVRLRASTGLDDLVPIHRLDRGTAGVVLFSKNPESRGAYQTMFEDRRVHKTYECVSALPAGMPADQLARRFPVTVRSRIEKTKGVLVSQSVAYPVSESGGRPELRRRPRRGRRRTRAVPGANASSSIQLLETGTSPSGLAVGRFGLTPHTGKTHQLRIHMALLGLGILHDRFYPELAPDAPDDFAAPLQLLAATLSFTDPLSGQPRRFASARRLAEAPGHHLTAG